MAEAPFVKGPLKVRLFQLRNGVKVLLQPDRQLGIVALRSCVPTGSLNDGQRYGLAHLVEHLVYYQADPSRVRYRELEERGASSNATTYLEQTCFHITLPPGELSSVLALDRDRFSSFRVSEELFRSQRDVVHLQEDEYRENSWRVLHQRAWPLLYGLDPARMASGPWRRQLDNITLADTATFFDRYYTPAQLTVTLVGDFDESAALRLLEAYHGAIPFRPALAPAPPTKVSEELRQPSLIFRSAEMDEPRLILAFRSPPSQKEASAELEVLSEVLAERLRLRLEDTTSQVFTWEASSQTVAMRFVEVVLWDEDDFADVESAALSIVEELRKNGPLRKELHGARCTVRQRFFQELRTAEERAKALANSQVLGGDFRLLSERPAAYARAGGLRMMILGRRYYAEARRAIIRVEPLESQEDETSEAP